jgi:hypothetical protein
MFLYYLLALLIDTLYLHYNIFLNTKVNRLIIICILCVVSIPALLLPFGLTQVSGILLYVVLAYIFTKDNVVPIIKRVLLSFLWLTLIQSYIPIIIVGFNVPLNIITTYMIPIPAWLTQLYFVRRKIYEENIILGKFHTNLAGGIS